MLYLQLVVEISIAVQIQNIVELLLLPAHASCQIEQNQQEQAL